MLVSQGVYRRNRRFEGPDRVPGVTRAGKSTRGHNTLTFNGVDERPGWSAQDDQAVSAIAEFNCSDTVRSPELRVLFTLSS